MSKVIRANKQGGFAGVVFLVIGLIAIIMAAIAAMSRNNAVGAPEQTARTNASVLLKQTSDLKTGFDRMLIDGRGGAAITFTNVGVNGLFSLDAGTQYAVLPVPPVTAVAAGEVPAYTYNNLVVLPGVGTAAADAVFTVTNLTREVCQQVNRILYNDASAAAPAISAGAPEAWETLTAINDGANVAVNYVGRTEGCVQTSTAGNFVYYKTALEN